MEKTLKLFYLFSINWSFKVDGRCRGSKLCIPTKHPNYLPTQK